MQPTRPQQDQGAAVSTRRASGIERLKALTQRGGLARTSSAESADLPVVGAKMQPSSRPDTTGTEGFESPERQREIEQVSKAEGWRIRIMHCSTERLGSMNLYMPLLSADHQRGGQAVCAPAQRHIIRWAQQRVCHAQHRR